MSSQPHLTSGRPLASQVAVVLPAFNEEEVIAHTLREVAQAIVGLRGRPLRAEVVVVDDGSKDRTREISLSCRATVLTHPVNLGYGAAVGTGLQYALSRNADAVILLDADGQHDPRDIHRLLEPVLEGCADVVVGSRFAAQTRYVMSFSRRVGALFFAGLVALIARKHIRDTTSGYQCLGRRAIEKLAVDYPADHPDAQTILEMLLMGLTVVEVPTEMRPRTAGRSMHSWRSLFQYPLRMVLSIVVVVLRCALRHAGRARKGDSDS